MKKLELRDLIVYYGTKKELSIMAKESGINLGSMCDTLEYDRNRNLTLLLNSEHDHVFTKTTVRGLLFSHALMNVNNEEISGEECVNIGFELVNKINEIESKLELN